MERMKVSQLAKELGLKSSELIDKLNKMGIDVKSHLSELAEDTVIKLRNGGNKVKEIKKDENKNKEQVHIIRRNIKVINTDGNTSEVDQITTNISGDVKKTHQTVVEKTNTSSYSKEGLGVITPKKPFSKFPNLNTGTVVITRNGKPIDKKEEVSPETKVDKKEEISKKADIEEIKKDEVIIPKKENIIENKNNIVERRPYNNNGYNNSNVERRPYNNNGYNNSNGERRPHNNNGTTNTPSRPNATYGNRPYNPNGNNNNTGERRPYNNNGYNNNSNGERRPYNNNGTTNTPSRPNATYGNRPYNQNGNNNNTGERRPYNNNGYNNNSNGERRPYNNNFRTPDNTAYQVTKFIKQAATLPIEQKETREYSNVSIDKKKYNSTDKNNDGKKEKLDKNRLREEQSRVSTSKLKGLEVDSKSGLLDLYVRDSDLSRKSARRREKTRKPELKQTIIIPMTEVKLPDTISVKDFAERIKKQSSEVIKKLFKLGILATVNQEIDFDTAFLIAEEFGIIAEKEVIVTEEDILFDETEDIDENLESRPPIVVVMGHVDHGKTSLLDRLRSENVAEGEAGGITQHIGAYKIKIGEREVCFLDTPGHEAFTAMRSRGAQVTDIAIIVVAADDGIKPQTIEAINHAKAAGVSIVVAINKIDKPTANVDKVKQELMQQGLVSEEWGGDTIMVPISALTGAGIDNLLEMLLLVADMKELKANPNKQSKGTVLEARLDKTKGTIASVIVQRGTLNVGDTIVVGDMVGKIRAMKDDKGRKVKTAGPSTPVEILGLSHVPQTGDTFYEVENDKVAKQLIDKRKATVRRDLIKEGAKVTLDDLFGKIKDGEIKELNVIIKADVQGSVEALKDSLLKLSNDQVRIRVLHAATGGVKESDVTLASVSNAIIIGFNVRPENLALLQSKKEKVDMRLYSVIYDAINDVETAMKGMIPKKYKEVMLGTAEVRKVFKLTDIGIVAGCYVKSGKIVRNTMVRLVRDSIVIFEIKIDSLKREKDDVKDVAEGYECGIKLEKCSDIKEGDIFECFQMEEEKSE